MITSGFDTGGHGGDIAYGYNKKLGPAKVEWDIRPWLSVNPAAGGWAANAFYLELSAKFSVETNAEKGDHPIPFVPGVAKYFGFTAPETYTTSGNKYGFKYELKKAISGISYGRSLSNYDQHKYVFDAGQEVVLWKKKAGSTESKWVWGAVGGGSLTYSNLYGGFGRSSIRVGFYTQFSVDSGPTEVAKYKLNIVGVEVAIKSNAVNTDTGEPLNPAKKPKLYAVLRPFGDVVEDADGNQQYTLDLSKLFNL